MAHSKVANAMVVHPRISYRGWSGIRKVASRGASSRNLTDQARGILGGALDPDRFLFTHCTIVASVDTEIVPNAKLGRVKLGANGPTILRKYADFYIKPQCTQFVNSNGDSWSRQVLAAAFPTFIGGHNFQEHVQVEAKSKGRIIDAVSRDIGDSLYIDILVATDRKHATLIQDIQSGRMGTLSMGCTTDFTICTKCGHVAVDETELCDHIKTAKLNSFIDERGVQRVVAELCGHIAYKDNPAAPGGVRFIEASWVEVPAFQGAVMRNIISVEEGRALQAKTRRVLTLPAPATSWSDSAIRKAASLQVADFPFDEGGGGDEGGGDAAPAAPTEKAKKPFEDLEDDIYKSVTKQVKDRVKRELREKNTPSDDSSSTNETLVKEANTAKSAMRQRYAAAVQAVVEGASSEAALVNGVATINAGFGLEVPVLCYRTALEVGPLSRHDSPQSYLRSCRKYAGRDFTPAEFRVVVRLGSLLSAWERRNNPTSPRSLPCPTASA